MIDHISHYCQSKFFLLLTITHYEIMINWFFFAEKNKRRKKFSSYYHCLYFFFFLILFSFIYFFFYDTEPEIIATVFNSSRLKTEMWTVSDNFLSFHHFSQYMEKNSENETFSTGIFPQLTQSLFPRGGCCGERRSETFVNILTLTKYFFLT